MSENVLEITFRLQNIDHLFEEPDIMPFSDYYAEYSAKSGLDYVVGELYAHPSTDRVQLEVRLPENQLQPDLEARTQEAIGSYSEAWSRSAQQEIAETRYKGRSTLLIGFIVFFLFNGLGLWLNQANSIWLENIGDAFIVIAWIIVWFSLDTLTVGIWQNRIDKRAFLALQSVDLTITADSGAGSGLEQ